MLNYPQKKSGFNADRNPLDMDDEVVPASPEIDENVNPPNGNTFLLCFKFSILFFSYCYNLIIYNYNIYYDSYYHLICYFVNFYLKTILGATFEPIQLDMNINEVVPPSPQVNQNGDCNKILSYIPHL